MSVRLIGAGLPRTGTLTQKVALEMLGFAPCFHWVNVLADLDCVPDWERAMDGEADWDALLQGSEASVDWPGGFFWRQLSEAYPDAKVLLSVREPEAWERSFRETIWEMGHGGSLLHLLSSARAVVDPQWARYTAFVERMFWSSEGTFASGQRREELIAAAQAHNAAVVAALPPERLLVWRVSEGWEPLCEFLDVPVPAEPLPHVNDRETFLGRVMDGALAKIAEYRAAQAAS
ncbi:MAG: sulfotransferase family protein [Solirubrobacteraceae bacterium]